MGMIMNYLMKYGIFDSVYYAQQDKHFKLLNTNYIFHNL